MARNKTYIDDIAERVANENRLTVKDEDAYMEAVVQALSEVVSKQMHVLNLVSKGIVERDG